MTLIELLEIRKQRVMLEKIARDYPGRTIENIIQNMDARIKNYEDEQDTTQSKYIDSDDVRRRSTIQVLEYARTLNTYNQYGKADIDKNIAWLEKQALKANPKWSEEMKFKKFDIITNGKIEYEIRDIQKNQLGDWVYILYNDSVARLLPNDMHLPDGSIKWVCEQVDKQFELKQRKEE